MPILESAGPKTSANASAGAVVRVVLTHQGQVLVHDELAPSDPLPVRLRIVLTFGEGTQATRQLQLFPSAPPEASVRASPDSRANVEREQEAQAEHATDVVFPASFNRQPRVWHGIFGGVSRAADLQGRSWGLIGGFIGKVGPLQLAASVEHRLDPDNTPIVVGLIDNF